MNDYRRGARAEEPREPPKVDGRVPPHDLPAEASVVSAAMIDANAVDVCEFLKPAHFYSEAHRRIWEAILALREANMPIDVVTVGSWLRDRMRLEQVGGMAYITELLNAVPSIPNAEVYARRVFEKSQVRRIILKAQQIAAMGYVDYGDSQEFVANAERDVAEIAGSLIVRDRTVPIARMMSERYVALENAMRLGRPSGVRTGFHELDEKLLGLHRGELTIIAARPAMGKTGLGLALVENVASSPPPLYDEHGRPGQLQGAAFFSLEMPQEQIADRWLARNARYDIQRIRGPNILRTDWTQLAASASFISGLPVIVNDTPALHIDTLRAIVRRERLVMARKNVRLTLIVVDYLQLMRGTGEHVRGREQEVSTISRGLKQLAKDEDVAVVALAQLNREVEKRGGVKRPGVSDLRESGSIEQDADNILLLYRPEHYGESVLPDETGKTEVIIGKQRNGPTGTVNVRFVGYCVRFENM